MNRQRNQTNGVLTVGCRQLYVLMNINSFSMPKEQIGDPKIHDAMRAFRDHFPLTTNK
jgi:hypothetical protein